MRIRYVKNSKEVLENCVFLITNPKDKYFNNDHPIILEIGMGKGQFILNSALNNPHLNYIGVEKYDSVIARAIEKIAPYKLNNLLLLREDALNLNKYFNNQIKTIALNFSDPWPKKRHEKRRLTSEVFLNIYDDLFCGNCHIILKTDNLILFASSIKELNNYGYKFKEVNMDLSHSDIPNVLTEYEEKFMNQEIKINYIECTKEKK